MNESISGARLNGGSILGVPNFPSLTETGNGYWHRSTQELGGHPTPIIAILVYFYKLPGI